MPYIFHLVPEEDNACTRAKGIDISGVCYYVSRNTAAAPDYRSVCQESSRFSPMPSIHDASTQMQLAEWLKQTNSPDVMLDLMEESPADFWYWEIGEK